MRGIGLTIATFLIISTLSLVLFQSAELCSLRKEVIRTDVEKYLGIMDLELLKKVLASDLLFKLDLHLSRGVIYPASTSPDDIMLPAIGSWISSIRVDSKLFKVKRANITISKDRGEMVFDGGGYPISIRLEFEFNGSKTSVLLIDTLSMRHTAKIHEAKSLLLHYKELVLKKISEAIKANKSLLFTLQKKEGNIEIHVKAMGGPEIYRYEVLVKDVGRAAVSDFHLDYGFIDKGIVKNETSE